MHGTVTLSESDYIKREAEKRMISKIGEFLQTYVLPVIIIVGTAGNVMSYLVMNLVSTIIKTIVFSLFNIKEMLIEYTILLHM